MARHRSRLAGRPLNPSLVVKYCGVVEGRNATSSSLRQHDGNPQLGSGFLHSPPGLGDAWRSMVALIDLLRTSGGCLYITRLNACWTLDAPMFRF
jgi:hypothetical protein